MKAAVVWGKVRSRKVEMMLDSSSSVVSTNIRKNFPKHKALHISKSHARLL